MQYISTVFHIFSASLVFHNVYAGVSRRDIVEADPPPEQKPSLSCVLFYGDGLCIFKCRLFGQGAEGYCKQKTCLCEHKDTIYIEGENGFEPQPRALHVKRSDLGLGIKDSNLPTGSRPSKERLEEFTSEEKNLKLKLITLMVFLSQSNQDVCQFLLDNQIDIDAVRRLSEKEHRLSGRIHSRSTYLRSIPLESEDILKQGENIGETVYSIIPKPCEKKHPRDKKPTKKGTKRRINTSLRENSMNKSKPKINPPFDRSFENDDDKDDDDDENGMTLRSKSLPFDLDYDGQGKMTPEAQHPMNLKPNPNKRQITLSADHSPRTSLRLLSPEQNKTGVKDNKPLKKKRVPKKPDRYSFTFPSSQRQQTLTRASPSKTKRSQFTPLPKYTVQPAVAELLSQEPERNLVKNNPRINVSPTSNSFISPKKLRTDPRLNTLSNKNILKPVHNESEEESWSSIEATPSTPVHEGVESDEDDDSLKDRIYKLIGMGNLDEVDPDTTDDVNGTKILKETSNDKVNLAPNIDNKTNDKAEADSLLNRRLGPQTLGSVVPVDTVEVTSAVTEPEKQGNTNLKVPTFTNLAKKESLSLSEPLIIKQSKQIQTDKDKRTPRVENSVATEVNTSPESKENTPAIEVKTSQEKPFAQLQEDKTPDVTKSAINELKESENMKRSNQAKIPGVNTEEIETPQGKKTVPSEKETNLSDKNIPPKSDIQGKNKSEEQKTNARLETKNYDKNAETDDVTRASHTDKGHKDWEGINDKRPKTAEGGKSNQGADNGTSNPKSEFVMANIPVKTDPIFNTNTRNESNADAKSTEPLSRLENKLEPYNDSKLDVNLRAGFKTPFQLKTEIAVEPALTSDFQIKPEKNKGKGEETLSVSEPKEAMPKNKNYLEQEPVTINTEDAIVPEMQEYKETSDQVGPHAKTSTQQESATSEVKIPPQSKIDEPNAKNSRMPTMLEHAEKIGTRQESNPKIESTLKNEEYKSFNKDKTMPAILKHEDKIDNDKPHEKTKTQGETKLEIKSSPEGKMEKSKKLKEDNIIPAIEPEIKTQTQSKLVSPLETQLDTQNESNIARRSQNKDGDEKLAPSNTSHTKVEFLQGPVVEQQPGSIEHDQLKKDAGNAKKSDNEPIDHFDLKSKKQCQNSNQHNEANSAVGDSEIKPATPAKIRNGVLDLSNGLSERGSRNVPESPINDEHSVLKSGEKELNAKTPKRKQVEKARDVKPKVSDGKTSRTSESKESVKKNDPFEHGSKNVPESPINNKHGVLKPKEEDLNAKTPKPNPVVKARNVKAENPINEEHGVLKPGEEDLNAKTPKPKPVVKARDVKPEKPINEDNGVLQPGEENFNAKTPKPKPVMKDRNVKAKNPINEEHGVLKSGEEDLNAKTPKPKPVVKPRDGKPESSINYEHGLLKPGEKDLNAKTPKPKPVVKPRDVKPENPINDEYGVLRPGEENLNAKTPKPKPAVKARNVKPEIPINDEHGLLKPGAEDLNAKTPKPKPVVKARDIKPKVKDGKSSQTSEPKESAVKNNPVGHGSRSVPESPINDEHGMLKPGAEDLNAKTPKPKPLVKVRDVKPKVKDGKSSQTSEPKESVVKNNPVGHGSRSVPESPINDEHGVLKPEEEDLFAKTPKPKPVVKARDIKPKVKDGKSSQTSEPKESAVKNNPVGHGSRSVPESPINDEHGVLKPGAEDLFAKTPKPKPVVKPRDVKPENPINDEYGVLRPGEEDLNAKTPKPKPVVKPRDVKPENPINDEYGVLRPGGEDLNAKTPKPKPVVKARNVKPENPINDEHGFLKSGEQDLDAKTPKPKPVVKARDVKPKVKESKNSQIVEPKESAGKNIAELSDGVSQSQKKPEHAHTPEGEYEQVLEEFEDDVQTNPEVETKALDGSNQLSTNSNNNRRGTERNKLDTKKDPEMIRPLKHTCAVGDIIQGKEPRPKTPVSENNATPESKLKGNTNSTADKYMNEQVPQKHEGANHYLRSVMAAKSPKESKQSSLNPKEEEKTSMNSEAKNTQDSGILSDLDMTGKSKKPEQLYKGDFAPKENNSKENPKNEEVSSVLDTQPNKRNSLKEDGNKEEVLAESEHKNPSENDMHSQQPNISLGVKNSVKSHLPRASSRSTPSASNNIEVPQKNVPTRDNILSNEPEAKKETTESNGNDIRQAPLKHDEFDTQEPDENEQVLEEYDEEQDMDRPENFHKKEIPNFTSGPKIPAGSRKPSAPTATLYPSASTASPQEPSTPASTSSQPSESSKLPGKVLKSGDFKFPSKDVTQPDELPTTKGLEEIPDLDEETVLGEFSEEQEATESVPEDVPDPDVRGTGIQILKDYIIDEQYDKLS